MTELRDDLAGETEEQAWARHQGYFDDLVARRGYEEAYDRSANPGPCGCLGKRGGSPHCSCRMMIMTAHKNRRPAA